MKKISDDKMSLSNVCTFDDEAAAQKFLARAANYFNDVEAEAVEFITHKNVFGRTTVYAPGSVITHSPLWCEIQAFAAGFYSNMS